MILLILRLLIGRRCRCEPCVEYVVVRPGEHIVFWLVA